MVIAAPFSIVAVPVVTVFLSADQIVVVVVVVTVAVATPLMKFWIPTARNMNILLYRCILLLNLTLLLLTVSVSRMIFSNVHFLEHHDADDNVVVSILMMGLYCFLIALKVFQCNKILSQFLGLLL